MGISHKWNGTVLTIYSDSGTSSADLKGEKGDDGVRGAQGRAGKDGISGNVFSVNGKMGDIVLTATDVGATSVEELESLGYATQEYVSAEIAKAQIAGGAGTGEVDLSAYYTKSETEGVIDSKMDARLEDYYTIEETETAIVNALGASSGGQVDLSNIYTKAQVDDLITGANNSTDIKLTNYYTKSETLEVIKAQVALDLETYIGVIDNGSY